MGKTKDLIIHTLVEKNQTRKQVAGHTQDAYEMIKAELIALTSEYNAALKEKGEPELFQYREKGVSELEMRVGEDLLIFQHTPYIYEFHKSHGVWKISYVYENKMTRYAGIINIYNFLFESFEYNRKDDLGYLIGRIFINKDMHYFVEGKRQLGFLYNDFGNAVLESNAVRDIINSAILYSLDFDMLVPPYDKVKISSVSDMEESISTNKQKLGKRLGFKFYADDDEEA